jgi:hypothetical protein
MAVNFAYDVYVFFYSYEGLNVYSRQLEQVSDLNIIALLAHTCKDRDDGAK